MARLHGKNGGMTANGKNIYNFVSWEVEETADEVDSTAMRDEAKEYLDGFKSWTAQGSFYFEKVSGSGDGKALGQRELKIGDTVAATFEMDEDGNQYSGNVKILTLRTVTEKDGIVTKSFTGRGIGALTDGTSS